MPDWSHPVMSCGTLWFYRRGAQTPRTFLGGGSCGQKTDLKVRYWDHCWLRQPVTSKILWSMLAAHWAGWSVITLTYTPAGKRVLTADVGFLRELCWQSYIRRYMQLMLGTCQYLAESPHLHRSEEKLVSRYFFLFGIFPHKK